VADRSAIAALFAPLVPPGTALAAAAIEGDAPALAHEEETIVARAVAKRRREVAFGRDCGRRALAELGVTVASIPAGDRGMPLWPAGIAGSITHTDAHAAAAVTRSVRSLGIDLESVEHAGRVAELWNQVTTAAERARFAPSVTAALVFSAKESVYKCLFPIGGLFLEFQDVELACEADTFTVIRAEGYDPSAMRGRFALTEDHVATVAVI
jgi:4'-phosphopantetheinyl transferase EntD